VDECKPLGGGSHTAVESVHRRCHGWAVQLDPGFTPGCSRLVSALEARIWWTACKLCFQFPLAPLHHGAVPPVRAQHVGTDSCILLVTSLDVFEFQERGFEMRLMTWRALFVSPYMEVVLPVLDALGPEYTLVGPGGPIPYTLYPIPQP
jgi:hypothetical protein